MAVLLAAAPRAQAEGHLAECAPVGTTTHVTGTVTCQLLDSEAIGASTPFNYYVPAVCTMEDRCPVVYLLHGFGGDHRSMLGTAEQPSAFVRALTHRPPVDPGTAAEPWTLSPDTWVPAEPLRAVLVAPHGRTMEGGHGPGPGLDSFWVDWNPRYAAGGDSEAYGTPPPRFSTHLVEELVPAVEALLPVEPGAATRALDGISLGGYGSYLNGLQRPDRWASVGSISGAHNFLFAPGVDPIAGPGPDRTSIVGVIGSAAPHLRVPGRSGSVPLASLPPQMQGFAVALLALGDPSADEAWFRGHMPRDLALNARAIAGGQQVTRWRAFVNDAVPRRPGDLGPSYPVAQAFEDIVLPMNVETDLAFEALGVDRQFEIHPGLHSGVYWDPWLRSQLEHHLSNLGRRFRADQFDHRSVLPEFEVWGWRFSVDREAVELLHVWDVTCERLTLQGSGRVTVVPPPRCGAGAVTVDLGSGAPVDEPAGSSGTPVSGTTLTVDLESPHHGRRPGAPPARPSYARQP